MTRKPGNKKKVIFIIAGALLAVSGLIALIGGAAVMYLNNGTDSEDYSLSQSYSIKTSAHAFALWVAPMQGPGFLSWLGYNNTGATKWVVTSSDPKQEIFVGWSKASDIEPYIDGFSYETPDQSWHWRTFAYDPKITIPSTAINGQGSPTRPPQDESFWLETSTTTNSTLIDWNRIWDSSQGMNVLVVMNSNGSSGVKASIQLGFKVPILTWLPYLLVPLGIFLLILGILIFKRRYR
jgi:hypothetical protein